MNYRHALPNVVSVDELAVTPDESLYVRFDSLSRERDRADRDGYDTLPWEIELAYVQREIQIRKERIRAHERYIETAPPDEEYEYNGQYSY